jgi:tRNA A-37 threonylcarbamoyl transferase component Bud32
MPLSAGDRLGPYQILAGIGAGGMGEVYRANDPRLHREVAIKVAAAQFSERSAREARLAASLNHPNICHIYDVGTDYLVMELVEGPTLGERLQQGPLSFVEALGIARQIIDALDSAHGKGIVHRDLKPANIKIGLDGTVKVLDFGLAKIADDSSAADNLEDSPTATLEQATRAGTIMGTAGYMAPEQARGKPVDKRADIWAFGVVLYEMLTGQRLFKGETVTDTLAAVLTREPEWNRVPPQAERLLRRCLERDPKRRLRDIGEAPFLLEADVLRAVPASRSSLLWKLSTAGLALALAIVAFVLWPSKRDTALPVLRLIADLGEDAALGPRRGASMALSPDGSRLVFIAGQAIVKSRLAVRRLDQSKSQPLAGTDGAEAPFFAPDGRSIGFFADGKLKKMDLAGGAPVALCDAPSQREGSWGDDDNIVFAATNHGGLSRVPSSGGTPQPVTVLDQKRGEETHRYPQVLPGAHAVLFINSITATGEGTIEVQSFKTGVRKTLVEAGAYARLLPSGHLVYIHRNTLFAAPMDPARLQLTGPAAPVLEDVSYHPGTGTAAFSFSQSGTFVYVANNPEDQMRPIGVLDEKGKLETLQVAKARYAEPRLSPDGSRLAVTLQAGSTTNVWIYEWRSQRFSRLALGGNSEHPIWTPDGNYLVFSSDEQSSGPGIYRMRADGAGAPQRLVEGKGLVPWSISSSAAQLVYEVPLGPKTGIWMLPLDVSDAVRPKPGVPEPLGHGTEAVISLDGRWLAYSDGQSGTPEVIVRSVRGPGGQWQVSTGGARPVWSRNSPELFYRQIHNSRIWVARYAVAGQSFSPERPRAWSEIAVDGFDLMADGRHAVVIPAVDQKEPTQATFLLNFKDDLSRRFSAAR